MSWSILKCVLFSELQEIKNIREQIPIYHQRREDLYNTVDIKSKI